MVTVATAYGRLVGSWRRDTVAAFRGVPFAAPPVGPLRWRPPQPPVGWSGERPAQASGPAPVQPQPPRDTIMWHANFADRRALVMSEDCLYLDVHTPDPATAAGLPVMVWVHGGGNRYGYGFQDIHDPTRLVSRGLVVVTINYRLGALGWLSHPELAAEAGGASGNYGLMDVVAALRWVRENIAAFGGDPSRVTLAGNSAGAAYLCHLMAAPAGRGLFAGAIGQSSSGICRAEGPLPGPDEAERTGLRWAAGLGAADLATLRRRSALDVAAGGHGGTGEVHFGPVLDGALLVEQTGQVFARGAQQPIPLLVGSNGDEGSFYAPADAAQALADRAGGFPQEHPFHQVYPTTGPEQTRASGRAWVGDTRFVWPVWRWARIHRETSGAPVWLYRFLQEPPLPADLDLARPRDGGPGYGAFHTAEVGYAWDSLAALPWPWRESDRRLADMVSSAWAAFVRTGDPNADGVPHWPLLEAAGPAQVMRFGPDTGSGPDPSAAAMRLHDALGARRPEFQIVGDLLAGYPQ